MPARAGASVAGLGQQVRPARIIRTGIAVACPGRLSHGREPLQRAIRHGREGGTVTSAIEALFPPARTPSTPAGGIQHSFGFVEAEVPGAGVDEVAAGAERVGLEAAGAEEDVHAFSAQGVDAAAERGAAGQGGIAEGEDDGGHAEAKPARRTGRDAGTAGVWLLPTG